MHTDIVINLLDYVYKVYFLRLNCDVKCNIYLDSVLPPLGEKCPGGLFLRAKFPGEIWGEEISGGNFLDLLLRDDVP